MREEEEEKHWADFSDGPEFDAANIRAHRISFGTGIAEARRAFVKEWMETILMVGLDSANVPPEVRDANLKALLTKLVEDY